MGGSWKVAYADFVTALMAFFLLMWIVNMASDETKAVLSEFFTPEYWSGTSGGAQGRKSGNIVGNTGQARDAENLIPSDRTYLAIAQKLKETFSSDNKKGKNSKEIWICADSCGYDGFNMDEGENEVILYFIEAIKKSTVVLSSL